MQGNANWTGFDRRDLGGCRRHRDLFRDAAAETA